MGKKITILNHTTQERRVLEVDDPLEEVVAISRRWKPVLTDGIPRVFTGGWSGYCGYDTVRYVYAGQPLGPQKGSACCDLDIFYSEIFPLRTYMLHK